MVSQTRRPRSNPKNERAGPVSRGARPPPADRGSAPATHTSAVASQIESLIRRIKDLESRNARVEADHAADAEQLGRLLAAASQAEGRARMLEARLDRERQRGSDTHSRVLTAALVSLRDALVGSKIDPVVEEMEGLLRTTLTALEIVHEHSDAIEQAAEVTKASAQQQGEAVVARAFAAVATRAHVTQIEIERVDEILATITEQARTVRKLGDSLAEARASLVAQASTLIGAVRSLRAVTGSLATGAPPPPPPKKRNSRSRIPRG